VDFDGTISEIAATPDQAEISLICARMLGRLSGNLAMVSVVSGRAVDDLRRKVGLDGLVYVGNHGAEYLVDGERTVAAGVSEYMPTIRAVFDHLRAGADGPGLVWQDKGLSVSVHYRLAPDVSHARRALEAALRSAPGSGDIEVFWGKQVLELRPPTDTDKGYAIRRLALEERLGSLIFLGDDTTDVDALVALKHLRTQGRLRGLCVAVTNDDSPEELLAAADYALKGVSEVESFLNWLDTVAG
jgi:trehalose 6-phosphate phosphatase